MANLGLPQVSIEFKTRASALIEGGAAGVVLAVVRDAIAGEEAAAALEFSGPGDPAIRNLSEENRGYIAQLYAGAPAKVLAVAVPEMGGAYADAFPLLERKKFNVAVFPGIDAAGVAEAAAWARDAFENKNKKLLAVLPHADAADHPAIVNFATDGVETGAGTFTASQYAARIAGIIAGKDISEGVTFQPLPEVVGVPGMTKAQADAAIAAGKLVLYHDGEKAKIARGVTSFVTTTETRGEDYKKIKVVRILNQVYDDIRRTVEDSYIGKVNNTYVNKLLIITAINTYYETLERGGVLDAGANACEIDLDAQKAFLRSVLGAEAVAAMTDQQAKEANTRDKVFLRSSLRPLDSIEDVGLVVYL